MEGGNLLGVSYPEAANNVDAEPRDDLGASQMQVDGPVALNRAADLEPVDAMAIDDAPAQASSQPALEKQSPPALMDTIVEVQKQLKRKRASSGPALAAADKDALVAGCRQELDGLLEYYREVSGHMMQFEAGKLSTNAAVGCLLEESNLGLSKLVEEICEKLKGMEGVSAASVRSSVLLIGQRMMYGQSSPDADVLEDESEMALWCWEVRDLKVIPLRMRGPLSTRRTARKKIHERITAIYSTLSVLEASGAEAQVNDIRKVSLKLSKVLNLEGIRSLVERLAQKSNIERGAKNIGSTAKESMQEMVKSNNDTGITENVDNSELQKNVSTNEKEIQKAQKQIEKELKQKEKEDAQMRKLQKKQLREQKRREKEEAERKKQHKRQEDEALKEQKRREKEEAESRKQQKKSQEEVEKEQKRREKEAVQLKKQLAIQKQASMMERFFKNKKDTEKLDKSGGKDLAVQTIDPCTTNKEVVSLVTSRIDSSFSQKENWSLEDLRRLQIGGWQKLSNHNRSSRWGIRNKPKKEAFKELKLQKSSDDMLEDVLSTPNEDPSHNLSQENESDKLANDVDMLPVAELHCHGTNHANPMPIRSIKRKLLQFDKSNRPAYYGTWRKKSAVVGPRCPLKMDPDLDYEVDSDDEWEEEDPGESLSDCEKDNDEVMEEDSKITDEEEDSFVVPDGYLSDNEGIQIESLLDDKDEEATSSPPDQCTEVEEFRALLRQQKVLNTLTEQALRKSQPLVISNLSNEKDELLTAGDLKGTAKIEQLCLQVLSMRICPGGATIDAPVIDSSSASAEETNQLNVKSSPAAASAIPDTDLTEIVKVIRSCRDGINKLVDSLHQKFPSVSKSQLNKKVREISEFVDNRWQVKKEVLSKLGLSSSPANSKKPKSIATYFSKRCLPPEEASNALESSPELRQKSKTIQTVNGGTDVPQINLLPSSQ
uniref:Chromatin assembly factor 1 subunit FSM n=1 Tax=Oryza brachyantha TaxID=4533 RepID=J3L6P6_ORYBR